MQSSKKIDWQYLFVLDNNNPDKIWFNVFLFSFRDGNDCY